MKYYSAIKRKAFESILVRWMNLEPVIHSEVSQREKNKFCITHIYGIYKNGIDGLICRAGIETDIENRRHREQTCGPSRGRRG